MYFLGNIQAILILVSNNFFKATGIADIEKVSFGMFNNLWVEIDYNSAGIWYKAEMVISDTLWLAWSLSLLSSYSPDTKFR